MIRISQLRLQPGHSEEELKKKAGKLLRLKKEDFTCKIVKRSVDARKKPEIFISYTVDVSGLSGKEEQRIVKGCRDGRVSLAESVTFHFPPAGDGKLSHRPVIIGTGPAGLFCGYMLACHGYQPLLLERGAAVEERVKTVERFWQEGVLDPECNVQFGEGGAGAFSDGKLNTLVKDKYGRNREVLDIFIKAGAPEEIRYDAKPHIGTDILITTVRNMRRMIISRGGEVRFGVKVTDLDIKNGILQAVVTENVKTGEKERIPTEAAVLAVGHSARDTFRMLWDRQVPMEAKPFAVGFRVEHPQERINRSQYGVQTGRSHRSGELPPASYKLTAQTKEGRSVYSFCMCPGGYVVDASSEEGRLAVNGMSYSRRDGTNANSAVVVSVTPKDCSGDHPLAGVAFQRELEEKAFRVGQGKVPVERYGNFKACVEGVQREAKRLYPAAEKEAAGTWENACGGTGDRDGGAEREGEAASGQEQDLVPQIRGRWRYAPVHEILPEALNRAFVEGMEQFEQRIHGFAAPEVLVSGVESRTSSPVRILRDGTGQSGLRGLYPCGEGAGYAGGITSAAMDGIRTAELLAGRYRPPEAESKEKP